MRIRCVFRVEQEFGERLAQLGLADARWARGTGTSRTADSGRTDPRASGGSHRTRGAPPRPARRRAGAACLPCAAASRARPASSCETGMPVARDTTSAISSAPTCVRSSFGLPLARVGALGLLQLRLELRQLAVLELGHLVAVALRAAARPSRPRASSISSLMCCAALHLRPSRLSRFPRGRRTRARGARSLLDQLEALALRASSFSFFTASRSIFSWIRRRSSLSIASGLESISILMRAAASSIRSIALSGRKRSVM